MVKRPLDFSSGHDLRVVSMEPVKILYPSPCAPPPAGTLSLSLKNFFFKAHTNCLVEDSGLRLRGEEQQEWK